MDRPLTLVRCPGVYAGSASIRSMLIRGCPKLLGRIVISEKRTKIEYAVVQDLEGLLSLVH